MRDLGPSSFKNVADPVRVYALEFEGVASVGTLPLDPVSHMAVEPDRAAATREIGGRTYYLCSQDCAAAFDADPRRYLTP